MKAGAITYDVLVIGAGVAGSAIATALARQGQRVLLVERSLKEPDRIVGELLQPGGVEALSKLGLTHCLEGIEASPIEGYHLYWRDQQATFWFCAESGEDARKPKGRSFHHGRFVSKLRSAAAAEPDVTILQATALEIIRDEQSGAVLGASCAEAGGQAGKGHGPDSVDADLPFPRYACGLLGSGAPVLMYQIGARETRMLVDIPDKVYRTLDGSKGVRDHIRRRVACNAPESVRPSLDRAIATGRLRSMPNAWLPATRNPTPGLVILGDALNMRHPVTGGGMTVALKDVVLLTDMLSPANVPSLGDTAWVLKTMKGFHWKRKAYSSSLNILAQALYLLFASEALSVPQLTHSSLDIMQRGFIRYVQEGERNFAEPAGIMGGITQNSNTLLFYYFFKIALYSIGLHLREAGYPGFFRALAQSLNSATTAVTETPNAPSPQFGASQSCRELAASAALAALSLGSAAIAQLNGQAHGGFPNPCSLSQSKYTLLQRLLHLSRDPSTTQSVADSSSLMPQATPVGWTPSPSGRGTLDIILANFLALLVCVWTVLHHNLQARHDGYWAVLFRKCRWAALAVCAPEVITLFAVMRWNAANISVREMHSLGHDKWTRVHAFYANAGGFVLATPGFPPFPVNATSIYYLCSKPQNVAEPTAIQVDWTIADLLLSAGDAAREPYVDTPMDFIEKPVWDGWRRLPSLLHYGGLEKRPLERIPNDYCPPPPTGTEATIIWVVSVVHAMIHVLGWWFPFPTEAEKIIWRSSSLTLLVVMAVGGLVPVLSTRPWFDFTFSLLWIWVREAKKNKSFVRRWLFRMVVDFAYIMYIIARVLIVVEMFIAFRAMPEDAYSDVDWTSWWPHANG
ncbi:squalene epoxidase-domain-containing protein [Diplogelasinospora grovesii]|uniref:squalene monooxygenase n=1 Tax=Diplogelasinospora grovesii TaxID=303347 RepID=A0AAN6S1P2_9PEZI|nr:squalene epoxidase-domain-containing protein [Diplogelasinospora grovesii]